MQFLTIGLTILFWVKLEFLVYFGTSFDGEFSVSSKTRGGGWRVEGIVIDRLGEKHIGNSDDLANGEGKRSHIHNTGFSI